MKFFYKFTSALLAFVLLGSFDTFHAAAYDDCDVNHDGYVDISDAVAISRYLSGDCYVTDYNRFDVNKSLTVDSSDMNKILSAIANQTYTAKYWDKVNNCAISFPTISGFNPDADASLSSSRTYRRYSYVEHTEKSTYSLTPNAATFNTNSSAPTQRGIIGIDDRYQSASAENTGIVRLFRGTNGNSVVGFIVGDHVIATAAHCVYSLGSNEFRSKPVIRPYNLNGSMNVMASFTPIEAHIPSLYTAVGGSELYDYALITVSEDLSNYTHFSLGTTYNLTPTNFYSIPIYMLGPCIDGNSPNQLYYSQGSVISPTSSISGLIYYNCDTMSGDSGSPIYTITKETVNNQSSYYYTAIAIHTSNDNNNQGVWNAGNRITKYHLQFFNEGSNPYIIY